MNAFSYINGTLHAEGVPVDHIAKRWGTPCYIYSRAMLEQHFQAFNQALNSHPHRIFYSVKANSNLAVLNVLARLGAGFDIVSGGELARVLAAGGKPGNIVFAGVGKQAWEIQQALSAGVYCMNVESITELTRIQKIAAQLNQVAPISLRINPDVDAKTHTYIATGMKENKFGIDMDEALEVYTLAQNMKNIRILGIACHIGSQLLSLSPFVEALDNMLAFIDKLQARGITLTHLNIGGGLGVRYKNETPPKPAEYANVLIQRLCAHAKDHSKLEICIEPGRAIAANAGILVTRVECLKSHRGSDKGFAIVDAAMNDLLRPALYQAWHDIIPVIPHTPTVANGGDGGGGSGDNTIPPVNSLYDVVGPICETGDFLGKNRALTLRQNDLLAISAAGAYGFTMSSNYNSRPRAAEVMVDGDTPFLVRAREKVISLFADETPLPNE